MAARRKIKKPKKPAGTAYQRKTRRISRWRSFRRGLAAFLRRGYYTVAVASVVAIVGAGWWWVHSGRLGVIIDNTRQTILAHSADAGLQLRNIYLEGRVHAGLEEVAAAVSLQAGDPILGVPVDAIKERLKALDWVQHAVIERQLPDTLHIRVIERQPIAVWQHQKQLRLIDQSGAVIESADASAPQFARLLLVVGENAPEHAVALMRMLGSEPELFGQLESAIRVGNRRWDVTFRNGIRVKLPADNPERAWAALAKMEMQQHLLARNIRTLDMRLEDRMFIDLPPEARDGGATGVNGSGQSRSTTARDA